MLIYPDTFHKFFSSTQLFRAVPPMLPHKSYYWDVQHYAEMAIKSTCTAFYPLWPFIIRNIFHPETIEQAAHYFLVVATGIFFITNFLLYWVLKKGLQRSYLPFWIILAYTLNPMAIFRVIGYTESLFSLLSTFLLWVCLPNIKINEKLKLVLIFIITFLMSLTRPILVQVFFATITTLITIFTLNFLKMNRFSWHNLLLNMQQYLHEIKITVTIWGGTLLGYCIYGSFCVHTRGDFFAPFNDQSLWGKQLGIHLELLLFPKSPLIDIIALYIPLIILLFALIFTYCKFSKQQNIISVPKYQIWWSILYLYPPVLILVYVFNWIKNIKLNINLSKIKLPNYTNNLAINYIFWFCLYFAFSHSLITFFTYDRLVSLGRYVFTTPFLFVALGYLYRSIPGKTKYQTLLLIIFISALGLLQQWVNYGQDEWLG